LSFAFHLSEYVGLGLEQQDWTEYKTLGDIGGKGKKIKRYEYMERTFPSSVLRTQPTTPSALAFFCVNQRKLTPENSNRQQCF